MNITLMLLIILLCLFICFILYAMVQYHQSIKAFDLTMGQEENNLNNIYLKLKKSENKNYAFIIFKIHHLIGIEELYGKVEEKALVTFIQTKIELYLKADEFYYQTPDHHYCLFMKGIKAVLSKRCEELKEAIRWVDPKALSSYEVSLYIGVYQMQETDVTILDCKTKAMFALKQARLQGPNSIEFYNQAMAQRQLRQIELEHRMNAGLKEGQFVVYIQPQIDLKTNKVVAGEALVRWQHPLYGLLMPVDFIELFEKNGTICNLDDYVFKKVCAFLKAENLKIKLAVNYSPASLLKKDFVLNCESILKQYKIQPQQIEIEVNEQMIIQHPLLFNQRMKQLKEKGFRIAMDDFGSGYSSFNQLKDFPFDLLKLDKAFLDHDQEKAHKIIQAILQMCKQLNMVSIMEGVETKEQVSFLEQSGCDRIQGFYYAKALTMDEFLNYLKKYNE
ncbi:MAG: EAL domain-containing protein [Erysipelotrichaceae bacterium]